MVIEDAERYGLSQLHQLRGRVGRGEHESPLHPLRRRRGRSARGARLEAIARERDGFELAEVDLDAARRGRGPRHAPARPAALPGRRSCPTTPPLLARGARRGPGDCSSATARSTRPSSGPLARRRARRFGDERDERIARVRIDRRLRIGGRRAAAAPRSSAAAPRATTSGRPPTASARRSSRSSATSARPRVLDLFCGTGALGDRGALARGRLGDLRRPRAPWLGASATSSALGLARPGCESIRADALRFLEPQRHGDASTSSSATRPIDSPTALRPDLDNLLPAALCAGCARVVESSRATVRSSSACRARSRERALRRHADPRPSREPRSDER